MVKELDFEWDGAREESVARFVSVGPVAVQVQRERPVNVVVLGNLPGMPPAFVAEFENRYGLGILLGIDLAVGTEVTVKVGCGVTLAKMMGDD